MMDRLQPLFTYGPHKGKARCQTFVTDAGGWHRSQCSRRATVGSTCKQHSPEAKAKRQAARDANWKQQRESDNRKWQRDQAGLDALSDIHVYLNERDPDAPSKMQAALNKYVNNGGTLTALKPES
jgi:hypothetical protein